MDDRFDRHRLTMHLRRNSFLSRAGEHPQAALKGSAARGVGAIAGLAAGPFFLISVGLNSWASIGTRAVRLGRKLRPAERDPEPTAKRPEMEAGGHEP